MAVRESDVVSVLDIASGREVCRIKAHTAKFSPDSRWLLTSKPLRLVDIASCRVRLDAGKDANGTFSPHSRYLYWQDRHGVILDLATLKPVQRIAGDVSRSYPGRFSKSGRYLAVVMDAPVTKIIDLASGRIRNVKMLAGVPPVFLPDERHVAIETSARTWNIEDLATGRVRKLSTRKCPGTGGDLPVAFSDSGRYVAMGGGEGKVCILDTRTRHLVHMMFPSPRPLGLYWSGQTFLGDRVVSINPHGVIALASGNAVVFRDKHDGKLLGTLRVAETRLGAPASALWQDAAGAFEITGDRTPWRAVTCRIGRVSVPTGLCFDVLERSGVARRILEGKPPIGASLHARRSGGATP